MNYLVIVPTYNESENIEKLISEILNLKISSLDIVIVDDNSPDKTGEIVNGYILKNNLENKVYILNRKNKDGLGRAYVDGFKWAWQKNYDYIISMDADFSHDPKYIPHFIEKSRNFDIVIGSRYVNGGKITGWSWYRHLNSRAANLTTRFLLGLKPRDVTAGYKCYSMKFIKSLDLDRIISGGYAFQVEMIMLAEEKGFKIIEIPILFNDRREGKSKLKGELSRSVGAVAGLMAKKNSVRQFIKFGVVGVSGTLIDLIIYNILSLSFGFNIYLSRIVSFTLAATNNYFLNRSWTFKSENKDIAKEFGKFFTVSIVGLFMNLGIMKLVEQFVTGFNSLFWKKNIPVLIAIVIVLFWNYFINKAWTFKQKGIK